MINSASSKAILSTLLRLGKGTCALCEREESFGALTMSWMSQFSHFSAPSMLLVLQFWSFFSSSEIIIGLLLFVSSIPWDESLEQCRWRLSVPRNGSTPVPQESQIVDKDYNAPIKMIPYRACAQPFVSKRQGYACVVRAQTVLPMLTFTDCSAITFCETHMSSIQTRLPAGVKRKSYLVPDSSFILPFHFLKNWLVSIWLSIHLA